MSKHQLTREHVLREPEEISLVLRQRPQVSQHLSFHTYINSEIKTAGAKNRLGLAIPKKLAKRAIDRNRIKRLIRDEFRRSSFEVPTDIVVKLKTAIGKKTRKRLRERERQDIRDQIGKYFHD
jgi:ribonuclease P protein component